MWQNTQRQPHSPTFLISFSYFVNSADFLWSDYSIAISVNQIKLVLVAQYGNFTKWVAKHKLNNSLLNFIRQQIRSHNSIRENSLRLFF